MDPRGATVIVIDSSYTLALVMPDETRPTSMARVLEDRLAAPMIWPLELANALRNGLRRGRLQEPQLGELCARIDDLAVDMLTSAHGQPRKHLDAALAHDLTPYDALYLDLALQLRSALATRDAALATAAMRAGVLVHG
jgi:predicted nucleic acid-binding protein